MLYFLWIFFVITYTLYQLGADPKALLTGAGITGLVIGIAAKGIFEDLIAGLFLIMEGNIHIDDWISLRDFRGEIPEIGARVSVIKRFNRKLIINNSNLKQFTRLSDDLSNAWLEIKVGPHEDIEFIKHLIESSAEWYQEKDSAIQDGPFFSNISNADARGITVCLYAICEEKAVSGTTRRLRMNTLALFRENGISFGF